MRTTYPCYVLMSNVYVTTAFYPSIRHLSRTRTARETHQLPLVDRVAHELRPAVDPLRARHRRDPWNVLVNVKMHRATLPHEAVDWMVDAPTAKVGRLGVGHLYEHAGGDCDSCAQGQRHGMGA